MSEEQNPQLHKKCECHECTQQRAKEMGTLQFWPSIDQFQQHADPARAQSEFLNGLLTKPKY